MTGEASDREKKIILIGNPDLRSVGSWAGEFAALAERLVFDPLAGHPRNAAHVALDPYATIAERRMPHLVEMTAGLLAADDATRGTATAAPETRQARRAREREEAKGEVHLDARTHVITRRPRR